MWVSVKAVERLIAGRLSPISASDEDTVSERGDERKRERKKRGRARDRERERETLVGEGR